MYLGLAATAFLLVMLHPSKEEDVPKETSSGVHPASQGALQVWLPHVCVALQSACCSAKILQQAALGCDPCKPAVLHRG